MQEAGCSDELQEACGRSAPVCYWKLEYRTDGSKREDSVQEDAAI